MSEGGFLSRWAKRKQEVREGRAVEAEPLAPVAERADVPPPQPSPGGGGSVANPPPPLGEGRGGGSAAEPQPPSPPTLADTQSLTPDSDFRRFVAPEVAPDVKNAALKKLFADPHFNVMDGLDTYIDDYSKPDPMPPEMLRQLASAKFLKMFDEEERDEAAAAAEGREVADDPARETVAQSTGDARADPAVPPPPPEHADPDLRLQQDDAPGRPVPGAGAE
jgi:hypothetical protein